jgi:cobyrinic acid a,c-diamide synthase
VTTAPPPGLVLAGTHSGCGKTTLAVGLVRALGARGLVVAPFKCGPDFLDPQLHRAAAGRPCWNLDGWFMDDAALLDTYAQGSRGAGLALVEGAMGLFDGADPVSFQGSSADLARRLGLPVVLAVDASAMGGSVAATVLGHARLWPDLDLAGVVFNRVSGPGHYALLRAAVKAHTEVKPLGYAAPCAGWTLPERHLGIHRPSEIPDLASALDALGVELAGTVDLDGLLALARPVPGGTAAAPRARPGLAVGLAWDEAFSFAYPDTLDRMERLGVRWVPFSPLRDRLPEGLAGLYLPGGYPELHAAELAGNRDFLAALKAALDRGLPCYAECGGLMLLGESLVTVDGRAYPMAGALPGRAVMTGRLQHFGYRDLETRQDTLLAPAGSRARGHEFHCSRWEGGWAGDAYLSRPVHGEPGLEGFARGPLLASYAHIHFASAPTWAEHWAAAMNKVRKN